MKIAENVQVLNIPRQAGETTTYLSIVLTWDDDNLVLIDAGLPKMGTAIADAIENAGFNVKNLTHIIITHQDFDHIGSVNELKAMAPDAKVLAHKDEAQYMDGRRLQIRLQQAQKRMGDNPTDQQKVEFEQQKQNMQSFLFKTDQELAGGEILPICGGIEIIHTPGHMPGHIVLYLQQSKVFVCGDAENVRDGKLIGPNPDYTIDMELARQSLEKLKKYSLTGIVAYHGGYISADSY